MPELPAAQRAALAQNVKTPLVYTNVLVRNWHPWVKLGVHEITAPMSIYSRVKLDYPVSLGGYRHPRDPAEPMCLHLVLCAGERRGYDARTQFRIGRSKLMAMDVCRFREGNPRRSSTACLAPAGSPATATLRRSRSTAGRTATPIRRARCSTGTSSPTMEAARQPIGRVTIANSDAGWDAYAHVAIDQADRAVRELPV